LHGGKNEGFKGSYNFYSRFNASAVGADQDSTVIVKADDDIVFIDLRYFRDFVEFTHRHTEMLIVHANIINNGVTAFHQFSRPPLREHRLSRLFSVYPPGGLGGELTGNGFAAYRLHKLFLSAPHHFRWGGAERDSCLAYQAPGLEHQGRFSINFFGARLAAWPELARLVNLHSRDNEDAVTTEASKLHHKQCFFTPFNVAHLGFTYQMEAAAALPDYEALLDHTGLHAGAADGRCAGGLARMTHKSHSLHKRPLESLTISDCSAPASWTPDVRDLPTRERAVGGSLGRVG